MRKRLHQRFREAQGLRLVAALGAVSDSDFDARMLSHGISSRLLYFGILRELAQFAHHLGVGEWLGFAADRGRGLLHLCANVLRQFGDCLAGITPLWMLLVALEPLLFTDPSD